MMKCKCLMTEREAQFARAKHGKFTGVAGVTCLLRHLFADLPSCRHTSFRLWYTLLLFYIFEYVCARVDDDCTVV